MTTVSKSIYEPSPLFLAIYPRFVAKIAIRLYFMDGLGRLMSDDERLSVAKRVIIDCFEDTDLACSLDILKKMLYIEPTKERGTK